MPAPKIVIPLKRLLLIEGCPAEWLKHEAERAVKAEEKKAWMKEWE